MSSGSHKRGLGNDSHNVVDIGPKRRKENDQLPRETDSFCFIDDVITDLRSIEGYVGQVKSGDFRKVVDKLEKSDILVRKKQGQDEREHHVIYKEDITELRMLIDEYCVLTGSGKFEKLIEKIKSDDRLLMRQTNHTEVSKRLSEKVHYQRYEPLQQELHSSQAVEQSAATIRVEDEVIEMKPDTQNLRAGGEGFVASFFETVESPLEFSNQLKNVAQINFNAVLLKKLSLSITLQADKVAVQEVRDMIKQRTALVTYAQYEYSLIDQQQFNQELMIKLRGLEQDVDSKMKIMLEKVFSMLQPIDLASCQFNSPLFRYVTDFDLLKCIATNNSDSAAAQHILRARKLSLFSLSFESKLDILQLKLNESRGVDPSAGFCGPIHRKFKYGMEMNTVDAIHVFELFNIIVQFYDVSKASISLESDGSNGEFYYQLLESTFGVPPTDQTGKIRTKQIILESPETVDFLRWFCPTTLKIACDPGELIDQPSLISDVDLIEVQNINADRLMENSKASEIRLGNKAIWSSKSIFSVLTAHRLSANNCSVKSRVISCLCHADTRSLNEWKELFESWSRTFDAEHGKIGRKVTMRDNNIDYFTLTLH